MANTDPTKPDSYLRVDATAFSSLGAGNQMQVSFIAADAAGRVTLVDLNPPAVAAQYRIAVEFP